VNPLIAVALGALLLGEPISLRIGLAATLVLTGIAVVRRVQSAGVAPSTPRRARA
jgi:drug/metabolite transporter (DMT)-like permease